MVSVMVSGLLPSSERLERLELESLRLWLRLLWWRHLKDPTWVVGEQRQLALGLDGFAVQLWAVGDSGEGDCFLISAIFILGIDNLRLAGFSSIDQCLVSPCLRETWRHQKNTLK